MEPMKIPALIRHLFKRDGTPIDPAKVVGAQQFIERVQDTMGDPVDHVDAEIRVAAYFLAERDGFQKSPDAYWYEAVARRLISSGKP